MSTNELDRLIVKNVSKVSYEYDTGDWETLTRQLAAARKKKRRVVFAYLSSGIAASVAIFLICVLSLYPKKETGTMRYASKLHTPQPAPLAAKTNKGEIQLPGMPNTKQYNAPPAVFHKKQTNPAPDTVAYNAPVVVNNDPPVNALPIAKEHDSFDFNPKNPQHAPVATTVLSFEQPLGRPYHKAVNISVVGGINSGLTNTGYALGTAVGKKVGNKFGIEVTVAYVGNTAASVSQPTTGTSGGPIFGPRGQPAPTPTPLITSPLNYLQFAPMADYSLSKKITLSGGADVQRLLQDHNATVLYKGDEKIAPRLDMGISLRTEYAVFRSLKAGLSYRWGANNLVAPGNNYVDRNYIQVQVKYKLY